MRGRGSNKEEHWSVIVHSSIGVVFNEVGDRLRDLVGEVGEEPLIFVLLHFSVLRCVVVNIHTIGTECAYS